MKAHIAKLVALKQDGSVDDSVPHLLVSEGLNIYGRNECSLFSKQISREHLRIDAWPDCKQFDVFVVGPNPAMVGTRGMKKRLESQDSTSVHVSDVIYFLPNEFPFRIDSILQKPVKDAVDDSEAQVTIEGKVCKTEIVKKRHIQCVTDDSPAVKAPKAKMPKAYISAVSSSAGFRLLRTHGLPNWANSGCVSIEDVIEGDVLFAILTNYMVDLDWLLSACPILRRVPVLMIHGESGDSLGNMKLRKPSTWSLHKPPLPIAYGTHHSKAMFLVYRTGVRIVIHTANLIYSDWNNKTQGLWMQDFPLKEACKQTGLGTKPSLLRTESEFETELVDYIRQLGWHGSTVDLAGTGETRIDPGFFKLFDYCTATVRLVASVPGYHSGSSLHKYGHMKLRSLLAVSEFEDEFEASPLVFQFSSLGSLDEKWIAEFSSSLCAGRSVKGKPLGSGTAQFVWPTVQDIRSSLEGYAAGGSVPSPQKNIKPFLAKYWAKWIADHVCRGRAIPHIKTYVRYKGQSLAWFLLTSSNLSKAAWGALQKNGTQLMIRSYELGVLFLPSIVCKADSGNFSCSSSPHISTPRAVPSSKPQDAAERKAKLVTMNWTDEGLTTSMPLVRLPVPYALPPSSYEVGDVPWSWDRHYTEPDVYGNQWPLRS